MGRFRQITLKENPVYIPTLTDNTLELVNSVQLATLTDVKNHYPYVLRYVGEDALALGEIVNDTNRSPEDIIWIYINACNRFHNVSIRLEDVALKSSNNQCNMCGRQIPLGEYECSCGCTNVKGLKVNKYVLPEAVIPRNKESKISKYMTTMFRCDLSQISEDSYDEKLDGYFLGIGMLRGSEANSLYPTNRTKIHYGYTLTLLYNALSKLRIKNPSGSLYMYARVYWNWQFPQLQESHYISCDSLFTQLTNYIGMNFLTIKPCIYTCIYWFLNHLRINVPMDELARRTTSKVDVLFNAETHKLLTIFSAENGISVPDHRGVQ